MFDEQLLMLARLTLDEAQQKRLENAEDSMKKGMESMKGMKGMPGGPKR